MQSNNKILNVLIACEESQVVCAAFRKKGHNAFSCDIQECSGGHPEWHICGDVLNYLNPVFFDSDLSFGIGFVTMDNQSHFIKGKWDIIIAHPPCTFITAAGACRMYPKKNELDVNRLLKALEAVKFFYTILTANCDKICVENPKPLKVVNLIDPTQKIQPYMWRDVAEENYTKLTYLWLKGLQPLKPAFINKDKFTMPYVSAGSKRCDGTPRLKQGISHSQKNRSRTFEGVAKAMADQWGSV